MRKLLRKLILALAYTGAAVVIILAIGVGIFRLMLPRLPAYQDEIKTWASSAIGMNVEFTGMNARWRLSGPELSFYDAGLSRDDDSEGILTAAEVSIGVGLLRLITDRELVVDRVSISGTVIDIRQDADGNWLLQGVPVDELIAGFQLPSRPGGRIEVVGSNIAISYEHPSSGQIVPVFVQAAMVSRTEDVLGIEANIDLRESFGDRLDVSATRQLGEFADDRWQMYVEANSLNLAGWSRLQQFAMPEIRSGSADVVLWLDLADNTVESASANVVIADLQAEIPETVPAFGVQGTFEYSAEPDGWLLGANQFRLTTVDGDWPQSSLQLRVQTDDNGQPETLRADATYFNINDLRYLRAWLPEERRQMLDDYAPTGIMRDLNIELGDLNAEAPDFDVSAELEQAGMAAFADLPGVREFSGRVRADRDGGRVEIESTNLALDLGQHLPETLILDDAFGTVIWRRNQDGIIVLSDSVQIRNADFDSQMSLQVSIPAGEGSPHVDYESNWAVFDVSAVPGYLPVQLIKPKLHQWLTDALVSGYVRRGTTRFNGALDDFPFEDGSGVFRIEARLEDATIRFAPDWPAPAFRHLEIAVENTRLYSVENSAVNVGIFVEDAQIEIPDLRNPVLGIETFATGTLPSIRDYISQSPIVNVFGGQLDRVEVDGDASFDLTIDLPIQRATEYEFSTRIRASDGTISVAGFPAPISELNGTVTVTRHDITSESLFGRFLGHPVDLSLSRVQDPEAPYSVVLEGTGQTTADALQAELGARLEGVVEGEADYRATVRFPNGRAPQPGVLQVLVESDLFGLQANLPEPMGKSDDEALPLTMNIEFPSPRQITTAGSLAGEVNWTASFLRNADAWDFDRGVVALGEYPRPISTRGLHIHGQLADLHLNDWLAEGRRGNERVGFGDRIRNIDLGIDNFFAVGQRYSNHRLEVDRSGRDWVVKLSGHQAQGVVTVPYDFSSGRPMTLDMERLALPGNDAEPEDTDTEPAPLDPRSLPALSIRAAEFSLGERVFGTLEADFERTDRGLESTSLITTDDSFSVTGSAGWVVDPSEELGQRTFVDIDLASTNVQQTAQRLAYDPGIVSDTMEISLDLSWPGGPRRDFMAAMDGNVSVRLGAGRLAEVNPGAGRVFGLMSFTALPRRLSLDFSDVFEQGFGYDAIQGDFRLVNGDAFTCNLTLTGPAADVGIVGRAGLVENDYDQAAVVSANVGGTLPVAGFFLGGPQVAAALLVFSQVFRKPLKDMGQVFYSVAGPWEDPGIDLADSQAFADVSARAGCLNPE